MASQADVQALADQITAQTADLATAVGALEAQLSGSGVDLSPITAAVAAQQSEVDAVKALITPPSA